MSSEEEVQVGPPRMWKVPYTTIPLLIYGLHSLFRSQALFTEDRAQAEALGNVDFFFYDVYPWWYLIEGLVVLIAMLVNFKDGRAQWVAMFAIITLNFTRFADVVWTYGWEGRYFGSPLFLIGLFAAWALAWAPPQRLHWSKPPWSQHHGISWSTWRNRDDSEESQVPEDDR